ncbi:LacI family DNA-binding transcriptional regulator [Botrimarina hoheduenensis]|uniref:HTH-type transcriptional regulator DegA n=1 Tax=Botrimarina hoheduenensis TaxID=2528000 RepID=A0A5C5WB27_9BACT|nr:LacI family DNA-binding transcriptional regulator [Botrimarina hoheduenensis]TWT47717.1 HTH-type transcriptional regulator DegA [Botrimarina hoheduenensis]
MSVSIDEIAERAGVSSSTVARVLRGDVKGAHRKSAKRAQEILRISEELGYRPNWRARAFSRGKTHTIGLLYSDPMWIFEDPMNEIAISFTQSLQELNYDLRLIPVTPSSDWKGLVYGNGVDGLAFLQHVPESTEEVIRDGRLPVMLLNDQFEGAPSIGTDDASGGYLATRHLIGLGHKRIVFYIADTIREHVSVTQRRSGYERAMREAGLADQIAFWRSDIDEAIGRLLAPEPPTAIVAYCHVEALLITHAAWSHGLAIPTDLSLVAFNDMAITKYMTPPLTVVGFETAEMGRLGAQQLIARINDPEAPLENLVLRQRLVIRSTTAPPSSKNR